MLLGRVYEEEIAEHLGFRSPEDKERCVKVLSRYIGYRSFLEAIAEGAVMEEFTEEEMQGLQKIAEQCQRRAMERKYRKVDYEDWIIEELEW